MSHSPIRTSRLQGHEIALHEKGEFALLQDAGQALVFKPCIVSQAHLGGIMIRVPNPTAEESEALLQGLKKMRVRFALQRKIIEETGRVTKKNPITEQDCYLQLIFDNASVETLEILKTVLRDGCDFAYEDRQNAFRRGKFLKQQFGAFGSVLGGLVLIGALFLLGWLGYKGFMLLTEEAKSSVNVETLTPEQKEKIKKALGNK